MAIIRAALLLTAVGAPLFATGLSQHAAAQRGAAAAPGSSCVRAPGRCRTVVFQRPPKGSKFLQSEDEEAHAWTKDSVAFRDFRGCAFIYRLSAHLKAAALPALLFFSTAE